jgi:hypothetical protein
MINYRIIADSIDHYKSAGFNRIESPWLVTKPISAITAPPNATFFTIAEKNEVLVASGEQSLLSLYNLGLLPKGEFQTVTPCFRDELIDSLHHQTFIKNELMKTDSPTVDNLHMMIQLSVDFFKRYLKTVDVVEIGPNQFDICYKGIELGSYGIRSCQFLTWIYGTGVAEPRLSRTMEFYGIPQKKN